MTRLALIVVVVLGATSCRTWRPGYHGGASRDCHETPRPPGAGATAGVPADADEAFARLRAFRNYYAIAAVGEFEHHFAVWFSCVEQSVSYYAVSPDGSIRDAGGAWGGLAVRDGEVAAVPDEQAANGRLVAKQHDADYVGASAGRVEYLGSYREVVVRELVPGSGPGDPYARMVRHAEMTLRADADLTRIDGTAQGSGGDTRMCWRDLVYMDCTPQDWIDFTPASGGGALTLPALTHAGSPQPEAERARFAEVALAAARRKAAGEPTASIDDLLAAQGESMLPPGLAPPFQVGFQIFARAKADGQEDGAISIELSSRQLLVGAARGNGSATVAGVVLRAEVEASLDGAAIDEGGGKVSGAVTIHYELTDDRGHHVEADVPATFTAIVDDDAVVITAITVSEAVVSAIHEPPGGQHLPGIGRFTQLDTYFGVGAQRQDWWPGS